MTSGTVTFTLRIIGNFPGSDYVRGTVFSESLKYSIRCFDGNGKQGEIDSSQSPGPAPSVNVPSVVLVTTAGPQTINFGNFTTATQTLQVGVKSTSSVNVAVNSGDQMVLAGAVAPYPSNSVIPYTMTLNGDTIANGTTLTNRPRAGVNGTDWPLVLNLTGGVPSGKLAGTYSDTITLTLTPGA
jgi:spore coat protein U-like protein